MRMILILILMILVIIISIAKPRLGIHHYHVSSDHGGVFFATSIDEQNCEVFSDLILKRNFICKIKKKVFPMVISKL